MLKKIGPTPAVAVNPEERFPGVIMLDTKDVVVA